MIEKLDFIFAKGKLSAAVCGTLPKINLERRIRIRNGRHPLLYPTTCVPLDFEIGQKTRGIIITGPNTGGKTVAIKTVGLYCLMAPVSYTHLDVYKRQAECRISGPDGFMMEPLINPVVDMKKRRG